VINKKLFIANWKLNHTQKSAKIFFAQVLPFLENIFSIDIAIAPTTPMLDFIGRTILNKNVFLAAQNVFYEDKGAFTGEWSAEQLAELGVKYCLVGHSERRTLFFETDEQIAKKVKSCVMAGIVPVICIGESKVEREENKTVEVIKRQVSLAIKELDNINSYDLIFAYEPIWAIGTKNAAQAVDVQEIHSLIKEILGSSFTRQEKTIRILYGGSVSALNIREFISMPDIDGVLVGKASLQPELFLSMIEELSHA
jgi:triosephosphate isomerase (TIM)